MFHTMIDGVYLRSALRVFTAIEAHAAPPPPLPFPLAPKECTKKVRQRVLKWNTSLVKALNKVEHAASIVL
jgi:hypothetical protein